MVSPTQLCWRYCSLPLSQQYVHTYLNTHYSMLCTNPLHQSSIILSYLQAIFEFSVFVYILIRIWPFWCRNCNICRKLGQHHILCAYTTKSSAAISIFISCMQFTRMRPLHARKQRQLLPAAAPARVSLVTSISLVRPISSTYIHKLGIGNRDIWDINIGM